MNTCFSSNRHHGNPIVNMAIPREQEIPQQPREDAHFESLYTQALTIAHNTPDIRQEKIEAIRRQIADGTYEIDADHIAESLIRENPGLFED